MPVYEVKATVLVAAQTPELAEEAFRQVINEDPEFVAVYATAAESGLRRLPPVGPVPSREDCVERFGVDPWGILGEESFGACLQQRATRESELAGMNTDYWPLCVRRFGGQEGDERDRALRAAPRASGTVPTDDYGTRYHFYYAKR